MPVRPDAPDLRPKLSDQLGKIVALHFTGEHQEGTSDFGPYRVPEVEAVFGLDVDGLDPVYVPTMPVFGQVVARQVTEAVATGDGWLLGRLIKPGRAYQVSAEDLDDKTWTKLSKRLAEVLA